MGIKYVYADDIKKRSYEIVELLSWEHIDLENVAFLRSFGSTARYTIARCHALGKAMQIGMKKNKSFYLIEVISERFDNLSDSEKIKVIIHELMHIPKTFGGGFIHHDKVNDENVDNIYKKYYDLKYNKVFLNDREEGTKKWF